MTILAFGLSHSSAPVEIRERVVFSANAVPQALDELRASSRVSEVAILSTCNRTASPDEIRLNRRQSSIAAILTCRLPSS